MWKNTSVCCPEDQTAEHGDVSFPVYSMYFLHTSLFYFRSVHLKYAVQTDLKRTILYVHSTTHQTVLFTSIFMALNDKKSKYFKKNLRFQSITNNSKIKTGQIKPQHNIRAKNWTNLEIILGWKIHFNERITHSLLHIHFKRYENKYSKMYKSLIFEI